MKMKSMQDRVVLVTGSTDGIGKETARKLAQQGAKVLVHGRTRTRAELAADDIRETSQNPTVDVLAADFNSLRQVAQLASEVRKAYPNLQILINNAGAYSEDRHITEDGFEQTIQVQYLAPFLLTTLLRDKLEGIRPSRIVNVTSILHKGAELNFSNLQGEKHYEGRAAYCTSKLALTLFTFELAARLKETGVSVNCVHPGGVNTKLLRAGYGEGFGMSPEEGAETPFIAASDSRFESMTGKYLERNHVAEPDPRAYNLELRKKLWDHTEKLLQSIAAAAA